MAEIINFPKSNALGPAQNKEDLAQDFLNYKQEVAQEVSEFLWRHVLLELTRVGCKFNGKNLEEYYPHMILVLDSIMSLYLKANDVEHPLQEFAEQFIDLDDLESFDKKMVDIDEDLE